MKTIKLTAMAIALMTLFSCNMQTECPCPEDPKPPKNLITYEKALKDLGNYKTAHPGVNGEQYALRVWVSLEDLENYIAYAKAEGKKNEINVNGFDFIFTQYKEGKPDMPNLNNEDYELNFMYAPTYLDGTSNVAFDPMNSKPGDPAKLSELLAGNEPKDSANIQAKSADDNGNGDKPSGPSGIANQASSCPTVCP